MGKKGARRPGQLLTGSPRACPQETSWLIILFDADPAAITINKITGSC